MKMKVRFNQSMLALLGGDPEYFEMPTHELPPMLLDRARTRLTEVNGCLVPASNLAVTWVDDETGTECFWTKFHLNDFIPEDSAEELARTALEFVWPLRSAFEASRLSGSFRMVASVDNPSPDEANPRCTIRFHRIRPGQTWLAEDLESYKQEAILACDFTL